MAGTTSDMFQGPPSVDSILLPVLGEIKELLVNKCYAFVLAIVYYILYLIESLCQISELSIIPISYMMELRITWLWTQDNMVALEFKSKVALVYPCAFPLTPGYLCWYIHENAKTHQS